MSSHLLVGVFSGEEDILAVTGQARRRGHSIVDTFTPYAVHGLDRAQGLPPSRLTWVCFLCGLIGGVAMLVFMYWTSASDWPINVGGKPFNSLPAFVPVWFEVTILCAGLGCVAALFLRCGLLPGRAPRAYGKGVTDDRFVLVLRADTGKADIRELRRLLEEHHAVAIEETMTEEDV